MSGYTPDERDEAGRAKGPKAPPRVTPSGSAWRDGMSIVGIENDRHDALLGRFETVATRTRKGRSTFVVTGRRQRKMTGPDPIRVDFADGVRLTGTTLTAIADAWVRHYFPEHVSEHHGGAAQCVCDDLTVPALVLDRDEGSAPVYDPSTGRYDVRDMTVRHCHCGFTALTGTDVGYSWQEMTPDPYRAAYKRRPNQARKEAAAEVRESRAAAIREEHGQTLDMLTDALAATDAPEVTLDVRDGLRVIIRRTAGSAMRVKIIRGDTTETIRTRAVVRIAEAVDA